MTERTINIGLDVGNFDTKTQSTVTPSGFGEFSKVPYGTQEAIIYNGLVYVPDVERFPYVRDKTLDDKCFILSLFGIAKEIISVVKKGCSTTKELQDKISTVKAINLGIGLPPAHISSLREKQLSYYYDKFGDGISFSYYGSVDEVSDPATYDFFIKLGAIDVYPQDLSAALIAASICKRANDPTFLTNKFKSLGYYAIDIGGYTVDVVPIIDNKPRVAECVSLEFGILRLYGEIEKIVNREHGITLTDAHVENVLTGEANVLPDYVVKTINNVAEEWINKIINQIRRGGLEFNATPVVFLGGGSILLQKQLSKNNIIAGCEHIFIANPSANAIGYKNFIQAFSLKENDKILAEKEKIEAERKQREEEEKKKKEEAERKAAEERRIAEEKRKEEERLEKIKKAEQLKEEAEKKRKEMEALEKEVEEAERIASEANKDIAS